MEFNRPMKFVLKFGVRSLAALTLAINLVAQFAFDRSAEAQTPPYCNQSLQTIAQKESLRQAALKGNSEAQKRYSALIAQQAQQLRQCRDRSWLQTEATWIRLYACDAKPGTLDAVLDRIVDRGYNQVNVEVFANGKVLLPVNNNPTPWEPVLAGSAGAGNVDLLAEVIRKGRDRGLKVYAWMFTLNMGSNYLSRSDRQQALAFNGIGETTLVAAKRAGTEEGLLEAFVDPYSEQARQDYLRLVQAVVQRKPDGVLFDYVRYPLGQNGASVAGRAQDLWIYGSASRQVLLQRSLNNRGAELIQRYLSQGYLKADDINGAIKRHPQEGEPMWQGRDPRSNTAGLPIAQRITVLQAELWRFVVLHAAIGVVDFLKTAVAPVQQAGIPAGVVFFPDGNKAVGQGYDSRLQFWEYFPTSLEWHPMAYATCGRVDCITAQLQRVLQQAPAGVRIKPVLAGIWQQSVSNRPPLEVQMQAVNRLSPNLKSVSHFAYSWQEPTSDRARKYCRL